MTSTTVAAALAPHRADHFQSAATQARAARLGMWIFLATEVLLFTGLFIGYATYRHLFGAEFAAASGHLSRWLGTVDTLVLITSSLTMALAIHEAEHDRRLRAALALGATMLLGLIFLGIHGYEYARDVGEGALPGSHYHLEELPLPGANMFFSLYWMMTGLHSIHVLIGVSVLAVLGWRTLRGAYGAAYTTPLECGGLYWHLVDLIWIFLYPLLYLI